MSRLHTRATARMRADSHHASSPGPSTRRRSFGAVLLTAGLATAVLGACGDDDVDDMDDMDVDITTGDTVDTGGNTGTTPAGGSTDLTTGGTATGDSATVTTPVSGSVSNDDGGATGGTAP